MNKLDIVFIVTEALRRNTLVCLEPWPFVKRHRQERPLVIEALLLQDWIDT